MKRHARGRAALLAAAVIPWLLLGCTLTRFPGGVAPTPTPTLAPVIEASPEPESGWQIIAPGVERRAALITPEGGGRFRAVMVRLQPALVSFRVHYTAGEGRSIEAWQDRLPGALAVFNAGFFDESRHALGLLVSDGQVYGQSFWGFGGMFQVSTGQVRVRSLVSEPYQGEWLDQAAQAFPMLIEGGQLAPQGEGFDRRSRRTVIGQDGSGRVIVIAVPNSTASFAEIQDWLYHSDLNLSTAFALDGGRSTGLSRRTPAGDEAYSALDQLPSVIAVYPR